MSAKKKGKLVVFDIGNLCDHWDPYDKLMEWKEDNPAGKVTLFAIPRRCSDAMLKKYQALDWVELAVNGWWHQSAECLGWTSEETAIRLKWCEDNGYIKGFRPTDWMLTREVIDGCNEAGFWVSGDRSHMDLWKSGDRVYIYNRQRRADTWRSAHGNADAPMLELDKVGGSKFKFVREVVEVHT